MDHSESHVQHLESRVKSLGVSDAHLAEMKGLFPTGSGGWQKFLPILIKILEGLQGMGGTPTLPAP
jgi:hypothetical protein